MWDVQGECGNFWRSYKSYGSHAYVVFQSAYDRFIEMLDLGHEGDSAFYSISDDILPKDVFFMPKKNLFIQYSDSDGVNNNRGYVFLDPSKVYAKDGKLIVPYNKTIPEEKVVEMGFPRISDIFQERGRYSSEEKNMAIVTMRSPGHFRQSLVDLINATGPIDTMLEVGSYAGESADIFAASGKVKTLWCIDPWLPGYDENDKASSTDFVEVEAAFDKIVEKHPTVIHKFKGVLEGFIKEHPEVHPNLVYIDACHTYEGCKNDIINALKLNPKIISGHDYAHWCPGVIQAVDEVLGKPHKTFCDGSWIVRLSK